MKFRRRRSIVSRLGPRRALEASEPLKGQLWTRSEKALREPEVHWRRRALAVAAAGAETVALGWLWFGPALAVHTVDIVGAHHLSAVQVAHAVGLGPGVSVISVDGETGRQRLLGQTWIRTASVQPQLPGTVLIHVSEWEPVAVFHAGKSTRLFLMSDQAVVLGTTPSDGALVDIQGPAGTDPRVGDRPLDPQLVVALVNIQRDLPATLGQQVNGFIFDSCGDLTLLAKRGWKVYFGRVLTPEEFSGLRDKLAALKAIAGKGNVDYDSADLEYVNVMNPSEPAAGYKSLEPKSPGPSPGASPQPSPSPAPTCK
ncbi:MAG TPA: FtsQ-type POTRA domain-containing protein [Candidatus Dormibacteraeota bacterium]|nr:FtsQ-type POTRA domain-containing protein [Candidatus Dormibacteraeota bacterium]